MASYEKIVVVTKKTALQELVERFNTRDQAKFYLEHSDGESSFDDIEAAHVAYERALERLRMAMPLDVRAQFMEREFLPTFTFGPRDLIVTLGPDGLVVNAAKYLDGQPLLALNPDPTRIEGALVPFEAKREGQLLSRAVRGEFSLSRLTMARAQTSDGQSLQAVNDLFIGRATHVSARYRLEWDGRGEDQSSSGVIVSTGAGSTGWLRSVVTGASGVMSSVASSPRLDDDACRFSPQAEQLVFSVREPWSSVRTGADIVFGRVQAGQTLSLTSQMPQGGVIFGDGVEEDHLQFGAGVTATVAVAPQKLHLIVEA